MPIGKNAIKRVANNGYSNVKSSAPDMENSVVEEKKPAKKESASAAKKAPAKKAPAKKAAPKKETVKSAPKKSMETEPELAPVKTLAKVTAEGEREGNGYVNLGGKLPTYLL